MCLGIPMRIEAIEGWIGTCRDGEARHAIDLALLPEARVGDHVLTFLGAGRRLLDAEEARQIAQALAAVAAVMRGETAGIDAAFADLVGREPELPPHLAAQRALDPEDITP
ncbi:HypC/HybG/HupF family hydrogenase formation chaperone [Ancylobacter terrae]|uniref:HypC/HybG/HupF family hydrogenase formation chaperone n=1 Tax=Ancylobacter sp. sgz301288 TaxID=3342077 RepID=UPI0038586FA5